MQSCLIGKESNPTKSMNDNDSTAHKTLCNEIFDELMDEVSLEVCFSVHRAAKLGYLFIDESQTSKEENNKYTIVDQRGLDIFGKVPKKKQYECVCPHCSRNLAASRFAPHLEKCMGMGRNSSRIASKRIANSSAKSGLNDSDNDDYDNADSDWNYHSDTRKRTRRRGVEKNGNGNASGSGTGNSNNVNNVQNK